MNAESSPTIDEMWALLQEQQGQIQTYRDELVTQRRELAQLRHTDQLCSARIAGGTKADEPHSTDTPEGHLTSKPEVAQGKGPQSAEPTPAGTEGRAVHRLSRGGLLKAAAAGVAGLAGAGLGMAAEPANANTGDNLILGQNNAADHVTTAHWNGAGSYTGVIFLANDSMYTGASGSAFPAALGGWAGGGSAGVPSGVYGYTNDDSGYGVVGKHDTASTGAGVGVYGISKSGEGVYGKGGTNGVHGTTASMSDSGVWGDNTGGGYGVSGSSNSGPSGAGVWGSNAGGGPGVYGQNTGTGYGGKFAGANAPLHLVAAGTSGPPPVLASGTYDEGALYVDSDGKLYIATANTASGKWVQLTSTIPIPPVRVMNTRPGKQIGPYLGPIANNTVLTLPLAGTNGIPATATGVIGNLTAADATAGCFLALVPSGASHSGVSSVNFPALPFGSGVANAFTVGLGVGGAIDIYTGDCSSYTVNVIIDITGYIL